MKVKRLVWLESWNATVGRNIVVDFVSFGCQSPLSGSVLKPCLAGFDPGPGSTLILTKAALRSEPLDALDGEKKTRDIILRAHSARVVLDCSGMIVTVNAGERPHGNGRTPSGGIFVGSYRVNPPPLPEMISVSFTLKAACFSFEKHKTGGGGGLLPTRRSV
jgi:hypothetical protein